MSSDSVVQQHSVEEAFGLLGNPLRVDILRALAETPNESVGFADLRRRVDERDSGKFNYHLGKLTGSFVRHLEPDEDTDGEGTGDGRGAGDAPTGYELTLAGEQVVGAMLAGTYTADVTLSPEPIDATCPRCDATLEAAYEDGLAAIDCPDCGAFTNRLAFPPGTVGQFDRSELPGAFERWLRTSFGRLVAGFCTTCSGRVGSQLVPTADAPGGDVDDSGEVVRVYYTCDRCGSESRSSVHLPLLYHPAVISFFHDHGVDVTTAPTWEVAIAAEEGTVELVAEDPPAVRVTIVLDDEELVARLDETVTVVDTERRSL